MLIQAENVIVQNFNITGSERGIGMFENCSNCQIINNNIQAFDMGVGVSGENNTVKGNNIREIIGHLTWGINCRGSNILISENFIENFRIGLYVQASDVKIEKNTVTNSITEPEDNSAGGITLGLGEKYWVFGNILKNLKTGILYEGANHSSVYNNTITNNQLGVKLLNHILINTTSGGKDNVFFSNNLIENQVQVIVETTSNYKNVLNGTDFVS